MPYNDANDPELIALSAAMLAAFTPEIYAYMISLFPTPDAYAELHAKMEAGYTPFLKGDPEGVKAFEESRGGIKVFLTMLNGLARTAAIKDPTVPQKLGVGHQPTRNPNNHVTLAQAHGFKAFYDPKGNIFATVSKVSGAKGYQVWVCEGDPNNEANWKLAASATNSRRILLAGINRSANNWLRIRAMRGTDAGPWSNFITLKPV